MYDVLFFILWNKIIGELNGDKEVKEVVGVNEEEFVFEVKIDNFDKLDEN